MNNKTVALVLAVLSTDLAYSTHKSPCSKNHVVTGTTTSHSPMKFQPICNTEEVREQEEKFKLRQTRVANGHHIKPGKSRSSSSKNLFGVSPTDTKKAK